MPNPKEVILNQLNESSTSDVLAAINAWLILNDLECETMAYKTGFEDAINEVSNLIDYRTDLHYQVSKLSKVNGK